MPTDPADTMRDLRQRRREQGLVKVEVYIRPEYKKRLASYIQHRLFGEYDNRRVKKVKTDENQTQLNLE